MNYRAQTLSRVARRNAKPKGKRKTETLEKLKPLPPRSKANVRHSPSYHHSNINLYTQGNLAPFPLCNATYPAFKKIIRDILKGKKNILKRNGKCKIQTQI